MYGAASEYYDIIQRGRAHDVETEAAIVRGGAGRRAQGLRTLLDVACGTGLHLPAFCAELEVSATSCPRRTWAKQCGPWPNI